MPNFLMSAGPAVSVGKVERNWAIRWGSDLGTGEAFGAGIGMSSCQMLDHRLLLADADGNLRKEGGAVDGNSDKELQATCFLQEIVEIMRTLVEKGNGASIFFFKPEWEKVPHAKRGMLSMDRSDTKVALESCLKLVSVEDFQGSNFFITLKEFPHMDKRRSYAIYSATKFGHRGFLAGAYHEFRRHGVHLSVYYPGSIRTPGFQQEQEACPRVTARIEAQCSEISSAESVAAVLLKGIESGAREITNELLPSLVVDSPTGCAPIDALIGAVASQADLCRLVSVPQDHVKPLH
ncbi:unnamed protein product [Polarella glacialis]|uniref:PPIase cyclophilin-type domain-containing protein n=1 Tax=Polarella glacialis TaxID=89957 RepID=A0A813LNP7_POLGL|nr:unnamed protein product [Polarella glacialis]